MSKTGLILSVVGAVVLLALIDPTLGGLFYLTITGHWTVLGKVLLLLAWFALAGGVLTFLFNRRK